MKSKGIIERMEYRDVTHRYFLDGNELMSVTTAFKKTGIVDFSMVKTEVIEPALVVGDYVHEMAEFYGQGRLDEDSIDDGSETGYDLRGYHKAIKKFYAERVKKVLLIEQMVCDPRNGYSGRMDICYMDIKNCVVVADWKTSKSIHPAWGLQTAAYANATLKCFSDLPPLFRGGIILRPDGQYDYHQHRGSTDLDIFLSVLRVAQFKTQHKINT
jgi:hypothetical protein